MTGIQPNTTSISVPDDSTVIHYIFHARDGAGNWITSIQKDVTIFDNDKPVFGADDSDTSGTTGDPFELSIMVTDNIEVQGTYLEYWFGSGTHTNTSMTGNSRYTHSLSIPNDAEVLHYIFHAKDTSGNWGEGPQVDVNISDNDKPVFGKDMSDAFGTTGEPYSFTLVVTDNIRVSEVFVEYWFGKGEKMKESMIVSSGVFTLDIVIPSDSIDILQYFFHAVDDSGNWIASDKIYIEIQDNDLPYLLKDDSDKEGSTGDEFTFQLTLDDNIGVENAWVEYWYGSGDHKNKSMEGIGPFNLSIITPYDSTSELHYQFHFIDISGNWNGTPERTVPIVDNDVPIFLNDNTVSQGFTGEDLMFDIVIIDNIELDSIVLEFWYGTSGDHQQEVMSSSEDRYSYTITIPINSIESLNYFVTAEDVFGLSNSTVQNIIEVVDNIAPIIEHVPSITWYSGSLMNLSINASDNIGIAKYIWENAPFITDSNILTGTPRMPAEYHVTVTVLDEMENEASISFTISILPMDSDIDNDGIPDIIEIENGLDINLASDASLDLDDDGLTNLDEFKHGTEFNDPDTDGDGMPDGWEVLNSLDPLTPSSANDSDGDGKTDLEEFIDGTDPNIGNEDDGKFGIWIIFVVFVLLLLILGAGIAFFLITKKRTKPEEEVSNEENKEEGVREAPPQNIEDHN
jgi:hypothetical protein